MFAPITQVCAARRLCWHASLSVPNGGYVRVHGGSPYLGIGTIMGHRAA